MDRNNFTNTQLSNYIYSIHDRVLKSVKQIEKQQKLARRWRTGETKFKAAALSLETRRKESVLETTYSCAVERMFLISLKNKYAGNDATKLKMFIN